MRRIKLPGHNVLLGQKLEQNLFLLDEAYHCSETQHSQRGSILQYNVQNRSWYCSSVYDSYYEAVSRDVLHWMLQVRKHSLFKQIMLHTR